MSKRLSPFQVEFWKQKGYNEEEAIFHSRACRPVMPEYWIKRFDYNREDAIIKAKEAKEKNNKQGGKVAGSRDMKELRESSIRCIEYWLKKGYNEEEAKEKVRDIQATFTLEKCQAKHGPEKGRQIWEKRQEKWQNSLNKLDQNELNSRKSSNYDNLIKSGYSREQIKECWDKTNRDISLLFDSIDELKAYIRNYFDEKPHARYMPYQKLKSKIVPNYVRDWLHISNEDLKQIIKSFLKTGPFKIKTYKEKNNMRQSLRMWVGNQLLRSSFEIYFYDLLYEKQIPCQIDQNYPNSSFRYDFKISTPRKDVYIEIAPLYGQDEKYTQKMDKKKELFGCEILPDSTQFEQWINENIEKDFINT